MQHMSKIAVISFLSLANSCLQADVNLKAVITAVRNKYSKDITLKSTTVKPDTEKTVLYEVPFVSYKQHRSEFVFGKPYAPEAALRVGFKDGRVFLVWRDERGFVGAFDRDPNTGYDESVPKTLLTVDASKAIIRLKLLIDSLGKVSLKNS